MAIVGKRAKHRRSGRSFVHHVAAAERFHRLAGMERVGLVPEIDDAYFRSRPGQRGAHSARHGLAKEGREVTTEILKHRFEDRGADPLLQLHVVVEHFSVDAEPAKWKAGPFGLNQAQRLNIVVPSGDV